MEFLYIIGFFGIIYVFFKIKEAFDNSKQYIILKPQLDSLNELKRKHEIKVDQDNAELENKNRVLLETTEIVKRDLNKIAKQKTMGFPWLAEAYAEYFSLRDLKRERYLESKKHPALATAQIVREIKKEKKELLKKNKMVSYQINYLNKIFPWLSNFITENEDEQIPVRVGEEIDEKKEEDSVKEYLTSEEYKTLSVSERNQKALDRYLVSRNKSKWAIGRDYEMYVGYLYEKNGYRVEYKGIIDGYEDMGRDIIAKKNDEVCIIQCKYWAQHKDIHEKHVFQLFGTTMEYWIKNFKNNSKEKGFKQFSSLLSDNRLRPIFFTSTTLSNKAKEMAEALNVEVLENTPIQDFPRIKCNINVDEFGNETRIYHLPMDQQYDRTIVGNKIGECYVYSVKEAEEKGFRRAFRHKFQ